MSNFTTAPMVDLYQTTLASDMSASQLTMQVVSAPAGTFPSGGVYIGIDFDNTSKYELVRATSVAGTTITIAARGLAVSVGGASSAQTHSAGAKVVISNSYLVFQDLSTAITSKADGTPAVPITVYANDAARDAAIPAPFNGQTVVSAGVMQFFSGGVWNNLGVGSATPNASTTVAGKVEIATQAEANAGTDTGGTGALLSVLPSNLAVIAQNNLQTFATTGGTSTAYTLTLTPAPTAYTAGQKFLIKMHATNGASPTINVNGLGAKNLFDVRTLAAVATGALIINSIYEIVYDGTQFLVISRHGILPTTQRFEYTFVGASSTQFDITNPSGTTFRYTYDGTGTNPNINTTTFPVGTQVTIYSDNFAIGNVGNFTVTASGSNFFEITNASGVVESNVTIGSRGYLGKFSDFTWTKPVGLLYAVIELVGGGGGGEEDSSSSTSGQTVGTAGGGGGGYSRRTVAAASLGATETVAVGGIGFGGDNSRALAGASGGSSSFGSLLSATGGSGGLAFVGGSGGVGSNGDININGQGGGSGSDGDRAGGGGMGGNSYFGGGAKGTGRTSAGSSNGANATNYGGGGGGGYGRSSGSAQAVDGGHGSAGVVLVTEFYN